MPALVDRLQAMMATMEQHSAAAHERPARRARQAFHGKTEEAYTRLAGRSSSRCRRAWPKARAPPAARCSRSWKPPWPASPARAPRCRPASGRPCSGSSTDCPTGFETTARTVTGIWNDALAAAAATNEAQSQDLGNALDRFAETFEQRSAALLDERRHPAGTPAPSVSRGMAKHAVATGRCPARSSPAATSRRWPPPANLRAARGLAAAGGRPVARGTAGGDCRRATRQRLAAWSQKLDAIAAELATQWQAGRRSHREPPAGHLRHAGADRARHLGADPGPRQRRPRRDRPPGQAASEAPRAAAEVVAELRQKLSDSMVRDTAMLEERSRLLATLETLLDAVNHASTEQRGAVDALVSTSAELLDRVGTPLHRHDRIADRQARHRRRAGHRQRHRGREPGRGLRRRRRSNSASRTTSWWTPAAHRRRARRSRSRAATSSSATTWRRRGKSSS